MAMGEVIVDLLWPNLINLKADQEVWCCENFRSFTFFCNIELHTCVVTDKREFIPTISSNFPKLCTIY